MLNAECRRAGPGATEDKRDGPPVSAAMSRYSLSVWNSRGFPSAHMIYYRCPIWQSAPAFSRPIPHSPNLKFRWRPELGLRGQALGNVEDVRRPLSTRDDPLFKPCSRDDQNFPANVASDEPRKDPAFPESPATRPMLKRLKDAHARVLPFAQRRWSVARRP